MRRVVATLSLAFAAAVALSQAARAADTFLYCTLTDTKGQDLAYTFAVVDKNMLAETSMAKAGSVLTHAPNRRPHWSTMLNQGLYIVTYRPDTRFKLVMRNHPEDLGDGIKASKAVLFQDSRPIATGACGYHEDDEDNAPGVRF